MVFFLAKTDQRYTPMKLTMVPEMMYFSKNSEFVSFSQFLLKAKNSNVYLLRRMTATEYPNLFITSNFMKYEQMTYLEPQKDYNWLSSELVEWKTLDSKSASGILYKPENFNPKTKYPLILSVYERQSDGLNIYLEPKLSDGPMNIPYFVSRGYLVFCPDINYKVRESGQSTYNHVLAAVKSLAKMPWVHKNRIGIQGHSWGGYEVNFLITRTNIFSAAASAAGPTNFVSMCGTLKGYQHDSHDNVERTQLRMGVSLWEGIDTYVKNSPVFGANKVICPLLMMHNNRDHAVDFYQGLEFFTALRYLGKKVWMLQYEDKGHSLNAETDQLDYTLRLSQFFDHYLKKLPPARWMTQGRPAKLKQIDDRFELDPDGYCGNSCKICKEKNYDLNAVLDVKNPNKKREEPHTAVKKP